MSYFLGDGIGIDLGTANTTLYLENDGISLREASSVLTLSDDTSTVLAVGNDAYRMLGKETEETKIFFPILDGAVTDTEMAALLMLALAEKATKRRRSIEKSQFLISMSQGLTHVEQDALMHSVHMMGPKRALAVKSPLLAALGSGLPVDKPQGSMIIVLGAGVTEIAVISMYSVVAARSMRTGSLSMDEAIVRYIRRKKGLIIGMGTAEDLKCDIGSAELPEEDLDDYWDPEEEYSQTPGHRSTASGKNVKRRELDSEDASLYGVHAQEDRDRLHDEGSEETIHYGEKVLLKGRDVRTRQPVTQEVTTRDIALALREPVRILVDAVQDAMARMPKELSKDILENGIVLSGGGALLDGLPELLSKKTGLKVTKGEHPHEDVVLGLGMLGEDEKLLRGAMKAGMVIE